MKREREFGADWARVARPETQVHLLPEGLVTFWYAPRVTAPLWAACCGEQVRVLDDGYAWVTFYPRGAHHVVTTQFTAEERPARWVIDIVGEHGIGKDGTPWTDDLYLRVVALPSGAAEIEGGGELEDALAAGTVSREAYDLARREAGRVCGEARAGTFRPQFAAFAHRALFEPSPDDPLETTLNLN